MCLNRGPGLVPGQAGRRDGQTGGEILPACAYHRWKSEIVDYSRDWFFLGWWPLPFNLEWWGLIQYGVYDSPAICY
jgi:hypothetical protein